MSILSRCNRCYPETDDGNACLGLTRLLPNSPTIVVGSASPWGVVRVVKDRRRHLGFYAVICCME